MTFDFKKYIDNLIEYKKNNLKTDITKALSNVNINSYSYFKGINLAIVTVGNDPASEIYIKNKIKIAKEVGIVVQHEQLNSDTTQEELEHVLEELTSFEYISGIILQLPIPKHLDYKKALNKISIEKDVDGLKEESQGRLAVNSKKFYHVPCTAKGVMGLITSLKKDNIIDNDNRVCIIGRSALVGKPLSYILEKEDFTVTLCHSKTKNLELHTRRADIIISAVGNKEFINNYYTSKYNNIIIDVGINRYENRIYGDVDIKSVQNEHPWIKVSPVPGGIGRLTTLSLMENVLNAYKKINGVI